jgi:hypothetical protein
MPRKKTKVTMETILELCKQKNWISLDEKYINANTTMKN